MFHKEKSDPQTRDRPQGIVLKGEVDEKFVTVKNQGGSGLTPNLSLNLNLNLVISPFCHRWRIQ